MKKRLNRYNKHPYEVGGVKFDSRKEAERYAVLLEMQDDGKISDLERQVEIVLVEPFELNGKRYRKTSYVADFHYWMGGVEVWEDVKSPATASDRLYQLKRKLAASRGIEIVEVM